jgi:hypothetical protein
MESLSRDYTRGQHQRRLIMTILKLAFLGSTLLFSGAAVAVYPAPEGNGHIDIATYASPEGNGHVGDTASYTAPEGNGHVDIA